MTNDRAKSFPQTQTAPDELPSPDTKRWTARRKAGVLEAVLSGVISLEEACHRYDLSIGEFVSWRNAMQGHGVQGLLQKSHYIQSKSPRRGDHTTTSQADNRGCPTIGQNS